MIIPNNRKTSPNIGWERICCLTFICPSCQEICTLEAEGFTEVVRCSTCYSSYTVIIDVNVRFEE